MKVKILIIPLTLVIGLALMIMFVYPAYSNMQVQKKALADKNSQVSDLAQKEQKVKELMGSLNANSEKQAILAKFLPDSQKEEEVIANLNEIASQEGVSVSGISVSKPKIEIPSLEAVAAAASPAGGGDMTQASDPAVQNATKTIKFQTDFNLYGPYDKIKNVINKTYASGRFNQITNLKISHSNNAGGQGIADNLQADLTLEFNYLEMAKMEKVTDMNNKALTSGRFDISVIDEIQKNKNTPLTNISVDSAGKTNPFLP